MQLHEQIIYPSRSSDGKHRVVMRVQPILPKQVAGVIAHGADRSMSHIVSAKSDLISIMIGSNEVAQQIVRESHEMAVFNRRSALSKRKFRIVADLNKALEATPLQNPWRENLKSKGPLREGIISVRRDFFEASETTDAKDRIEYIDDSGNPTVHDKQRYRDFYKASKAYLIKTFSDDCIYARFDGDEQSGHVHFVLSRAVEVAPTSRFPLGRQLFKVSDHELIGGTRTVDGEVIKATELLQDDIGQFFESDEWRHLGIVRGERRAAAERQAKIEGRKMLAAALAAGEDVPSGSQDGQVLYVIKKRMADAQQQGVLRKDTRDTMALDYLVAIGALTADVRNEASTRRARTALLGSVEELYGTSAQIIAEPERVAEIHVTRTRTETDKIRSEAHDKNKAEFDGNMKHARSLQARERNLEERESKLASSQAELDRREAEFAQFELRRRAEIEAERKAIIDAAHKQARAIVADFEKRIERVRNEMFTYRQYISPEIFGALIDSIDSDKNLRDEFFLVRKDEDGAAVNKRLLVLSNREVVEKTHASRDGSRFFEGERQAEAQRGFTVLKHECEQRGIDYANRTQSISNARDPVRAARHTDTLDHCQLEFKMAKVFVPVR